MAMFLGALEYLLEEGPSKNWFDEPRIVWAAMLSASGAAVFFWRAFTARNPIVDLTAFGNRNFWTGSLASFVLGVGLYGLTYIYPIYLARVRGFSALQIGETMFVTGLCQFIAAPIVGRLLNRVDLRLMIGLGFLGFAWGAVDPGRDHPGLGILSELLFPQMLRGFSLMFMMVPINNLALGTMPRGQAEERLGLFNVTRNLGGAFGLAIINTTLDKRFDLHIQRIHEKLAWSNGQAQDFLGKLGALYAQHGDQAMLAATRQLAALARREALVMALADVFVGMAFLLLFMAGIAPLMRRPVAAPPPGRRALTRRSLSPRRFPSARPDGRAGKWLRAGPAAPAPR